MIRTAFLAPLLLTAALVPAQSAGAAVNINGRISQIVNALRLGTQFETNSFTFSLNGPFGPETLFRGIVGVRAFGDYIALNNLVGGIPLSGGSNSVFDGGPYTFTHSVLDSYFDTLPPVNANAGTPSVFDGGPYKFTHKVLGSYFDQLAEPTVSPRSYVADAPVQLNAVVPVPEPASWAMMIGGFALAGAALRARRAAARLA